MITDFMLIIIIIMTLIMSTQAREISILRLKAVYTTLKAKQMSAVVHESLVQHA